MSLDDLMIKLAGGSGSGNFGHGGRPGKRGGSTSKGGGGSSGGDISKFVTRSSNIKPAVVKQEIVNNLSSEGKDEESIKQFLRFEGSDIYHDYVNDYEKGGESYAKSELSRAFNIWDEGFRGKREPSGHGRSITVRGPSY